MRFFKLREGAIFPTRKHGYSPGYNLHSIGTYRIPPNSRMYIRTGLEICIPKGFYGRILNPTAGHSITFNSFTNQTLRGVDVIDAILDHYYLNEIVVLLYNTSKNEYVVSSSDVVAQLIIDKMYNFNIVCAQGLHPNHLGSSCNTASDHLCRYTEIKLINQN